MYKKILVPIDGSPTADRGLNEAIRLAKNQRAAMRLLHVVDGMILAPYAETAMYNKDLQQALEEQGRDVLKRAKAEVRKQGVRVNTVLHTGLAPVAKIIVQQAKAWRADVIVLGTHGRRGFQRLVMGSDAESVVRSSPVPVLLVSSRTERGRRIKR